VPWYSPSAGHVADREHGLSPDTRQVLDLARIRDRSVATMRRARNRTRGLGRAVQGTSGVRLPGRRVREPRPPAPDRDTGQRKITARQDRVPRSTFRVLVEMLCVMSAGGTCSSATPPSCRDCRPAAPSWQQLRRRWSAPGMSWWTCALFPPPRPGPAPSCGRSSGGRRVRGARGDSLRHPGAFRPGAVEHRTVLEGCRGRVRSSIVPGWR
jgi:hypothetical protein